MTVMKKLCNIWRNPRALFIIITQPNATFFQPYISLVIGNTTAAESGIETQTLLVKGVVYNS